ncbi:hypothetical protein Ddc_00638 [Ditylenchus destructor]|nr:hypothetical protein Ddc_00638 [Ditylenchus destructor]
MGNSGRIASSKVDFLPQPLGVLPIFGDSASLSFSPTYIIAPKSNSSSYRSKSFYAGCSVQYSHYYQCLMNISMNSCKESTRKNSRLCVEFWRKRFPNVSEECFVGGTLMDNCDMYDLDYVVTNVDHSNNSVKYDLTSVSQLDEKWIPQRVLFLKKPVCRLQLSKSNELLNSCTFNTPEIDISTSKSVTIYCTPTANFSSLETISPPEICSCEGQCIQPRKRHDDSIEQASQNCPNSMRIVVIMDNLTTIEDAFLEYGINYIINK